MMVKAPWLGCYIGYEHRSFNFSVEGSGAAKLRPMGDRKKLISDKYSIKLQPLIEEVLPDGRVFRKLPLDNGWESTAPASDDVETVTYQGTVKGDARFEVTLEFSGDEIRAGGKVIDKGSLKNPRFVVEVKIPNVYYYDRDEEKRDDKAKKDRINFLMTDGKKLKLDVLTPLDAEAKEYNDPGIAEARIDLAGFKGHRFDLAAGDNAYFRLWNRGEAELFRGFTFAWTPDAEKDPDGKGRMLLKVR